jgi:hypothetical protein
MLNDAAIEFTSKGGLIRRKRKIDFTGSHAGAAWPKSQRGVVFYNVLLVTLAAE